MMVDWTKPIETIDGRMVTVEPGSVSGKNAWITYSEAPYEWIWCPDGVPEHGASIRNVVEPAKPVRTAAEHLERLEALVRRIADDIHTPYCLAQVEEEARAIIAEMTPPVDPDVAEAQKIDATSPYTVDGQDYEVGQQTVDHVRRAILAGIKRGRELEREGK